MSEIRKSFEWKNHRLTYSSYPSSNPKSKEKIVLIGGWCSAAGYWGLNIPFFQKWGEVIELDLVGHYPAEILDQSQKLTLMEFLETQAEAVWAAAGTSQITLVGHSTGGMAVLALSALYPTRIKQSISIAPYIHGPVRGPLKLGVLGLRTNLGGIFDFGFKVGRNFPNALQMGFSYGVYDSSEFHDREDIKSFLEIYQKQFDKIEPRNMLLVLEMLDRADIRPLVFGNEVPILLLRGDEDPVVPGKDIEEVERSTPNIQAVHFAECGHFVHMEKIELAEKVMSDFLSAKKQTKRTKG
ncbi:alpha/beta hydrolase superfamily protein [Leptospira ryugenii]|uniref:Alpha/beta hydrolase superfamily protein n=1 Tax=Leptospira ryugenii TaxID=1917863 RepID=A0A2P2E548_9LEPT|nr:alpha/beta hydrolase [Leptospira ryugenii]GBF52000.1 alpha/beta hydrolase superfamily protein [Leptospira ryugenii]